VQHKKIQHCILLMIYILNLLRPESLGRQASGQDVSLRCASTVAGVTEHELNELDGHAHAALITIISSAAAGGRGQHGRSWQRRAR
jgi:hypothetical protein